MLLGKFECLDWYLMNPAMHRQTAELADAASHLKQKGTVRKWRTVPLYIKTA